MSDRKRSSTGSVGRGAHIVEVLLTVVVLFALAYFFVGYSAGTYAHRGGFEGLALRPQLLLIAAAVATVTRRRHPVWMIVAGAACWALLSVPWVIALAMYNLGRYPLASRWCTAGIAAAAIAVLASTGSPASPALWTGAAGALPLAIGLWIAARRSLLDNLRQQLAQAQEARELELSAARTAERSRIAGEMHDVLAHQVSLMVLHAGALEVSATDPDVIDQAALIRKTGRQALDELRIALGLLRTSADTELAPPPTLDRLDDLVAASRQAGTNVELVVESLAGPLPGACQVFCVSRCA